MSVAAQHLHLVDIFDSHPPAPAPLLFALILIVLPLQIVNEEVLGRTGNLPHRKEAVR